MAGRPDAGASQTAGTRQSAPLLFEVPRSATGPSQRIAITKNGILIGTLEVPPSVGLTVEPKEQSLEALKAADANGAVLELAANSDIRLGPHGPEQFATIRVTGATFTLLQPRR